MYLMAFLIISCITPFLYSINIKILMDKDFINFSIVQSNINHTGTDAVIRKITDGNKTYILKQIKDPLLDEQFLLVNDCIASSIGIQSGIPINEVAFIPYNMGTTLKVFPERAATLHSFISGTELEQELPSFLEDNFTLQQKVINPNSVWQKNDPIDEFEQGLTKVIIESMSNNSDLARIVALDTMIGNCDRS